MVLAAGIGPLAFASKKSPYGAFCDAKDKARDNAILVFFTRAAYNIEFEIIVCDHTRGGFRCGIGGGRERYWFSRRRSTRGGSESLDVVTGEGKG